MNEDQTPEVNTVDELAILKQRASLMGIKFSNNIGVDALKERIRVAMESESKVVNEEAESDDPATNPLEAGKEYLDKNQTRRELQRDALKLVRIRITCMNPKKKDLPGEIITVANGVVGTVRKFIPFGEATENGYHVPNIIYKLLKKRKFLNIRTVTDRRNGRIRVEQNWATEFSIDVLPPLSKKELADLAAAQSSAGIHS